MPTSDPNELQLETTAPRKSLGRRIALGLIIFAAVVAIDVALTYAFETYGSHFQVMWEEYRAGTEAGERYDTICIGSSVAQEGLYPTPIDEVLQTNSFNMAGPGETPWASARALHIALDEHPVERVIIGTSYTTLCDGPWPSNDISYIQTETLGQPFSQKVSAFTALLLNPDYVGDVYSLAFFAPFTLGHAQYKPSHVMANIRNRLECASAVEASERLNNITVNLGKGYCNYLGELDRTNFPPDALAARTIAPGVLNESRWASMREMIDLCEERGVEFYIVAMPHPDFEGIAFGEVYAEQMAIVQTYVEAHGGTYLDFGMAKAELWAGADEEYKDGAHLNVDGAEHFSRVLAETIARIEASEDVSAGFYNYDEWEAWAATVDTPTLCWADAEETPGALTLSCSSIMGVDAPVEYEIAVGEQATDTWKVVRPWSVEESYALPMEGYGTVEVRVRARIAGVADSEIVHYQSFTYYG